jgi:cytochrome c biogenesis protein CcdA/glutaredoxin
VKKIILISMVISFLFLISLNIASAQNHVCIYFFYGIGCPHCAKVEPYLEQLEEKYPEIEIKRFEVYYNQTNQELFNKFCDAYCVDIRGVPIVFIGNKFLVGDVPIISNLENEIKKCLVSNCTCPEETLSNVSTVSGIPQQVSPTKKIELTIPVIATAALIDSINPCAFAVLIFLLTYLIALGAKERILKVGLSYIIVVYITYFLAGLGLFTAIQTIGITKIIYKIAAIIAIIAGIINIKDFFFYGKWISLEIPKSRKPLLEKFIHKATIPSAIILGFLVSIFELPCTGGVYLAILSMLADKMTRISAIPYLLFYNLIFVLPLFIILALIYKGMSSEEMEKWRLEKRKYMRLIMGIIMVVLGMIMLLGLI